MHFLDDLMIILGVSAIFTVVFQKLRQPLVLGYILAGLAVGEHTPGVRVHDEALVHALSELGVILLMFSIGIEFSIRKIARIGLTAGLTALLEVGLMISLGYLVGQLFGWTDLESLFAGACLGISSTMLVAKAFEEKKLKGGFTEVVFAVLVFEDMIAILLLAILTAVASGNGMSPYDFAITVGKLLGFLGVLLVGGLLIVPRLLRLVAALGQPETLLVASVSVCFAMAVLAEKAGYSVALGAFLGGLLISESGHGHKVEHELRPLRDVFAAIFFVSVGMTIDPRLVAENWLPVVVLTAVVLAGKTAGVSLGSFLTGSSLRTSVRSRMSLAQIGEFSFIIATLGMTAVRSATSSSRSRSRSRVSPPSPRRASSPPPSGSRVGSITPCRRGSRPSSRSTPRG
ncbi:MAG: cation:proton antiporter [Nannocystaceae bacterium]